MSIQPIPRCFLHSDAPEGRCGTCDQLAYDAVEAYLERTHEAAERQAEDALARAEDYLARIEAGGER